MMKSDEFALWLNNVKEDAFGEKLDSVKPSDIHPKMIHWYISFFLMVIAVLITEGVEKYIIIVFFFWLNYAFFGSRVTL